jgi:hypothetical protein
MIGQNSRIKRDTDSGRAAKSGSAEVVAEVPIEKPAPGDSNPVAPAPARLSSRIIIEFAAMAVAIAAIAYLYFHH